MGQFQGEAYLYGTMCVMGSNCYASMPHVTPSCTSPFDPYGCALIYSQSTKPTSIGIGFVENDIKKSVEPVLKA